MNNPALPEGYLSVVKTCKKLGIMEYTFKKIVNEGKLKTERLGWRIAVKSEWVDEYIEKYGYPFTKIGQQGKI